MNRCFTNIAIDNPVNAISGHLNPGFPFASTNQHKMLLKLMRILTAILFLAGGIPSVAQQVSIDTLFITKTASSSNLKSAELKFPIINTGMLKIDSTINNDLKDRFTHHEFSGLPTDSAITKWAGETVTYLDFEVTYNKNKLISLNISAEYCGAYCTGWVDYFTYDLKTGKYLAINDIIDTVGRFRKLVLKDKEIQYAQQKAALKKMWHDKEPALDKETYLWALEQYDNCDNEFKLGDFALYNDHLKIIENCHLPNAIKSLAPIIELKYKYTEIKEFLKINN